MLPPETPRIAFAYCTRIDGQPASRGTVLLPAGTSPDDATLIVIGALEEQIDRRIISETHQMPGSIVNVDLRLLPHP